MEDRARVLLVDDDDLMRDYASRLLSSLGLDCTTLASGSEAVDAITAASNWDLVFTDIRLPGPVSGLDVAMHARKLDRSVKVILSSGSHPPDGVDSLLTEDEVVFLPKPYRRDDVKALIHRMLRP